jgi:Family of unknown function (DUF5681)
MSAERTAPKQRGRPFVKGCSGNPQGRPKGARNAATILAEQLLEGEAEALIRKLIAKAKRGNMAALRLCIDRIVPPRRERPLNINLPQLASVHQQIVSRAKELPDFHASPLGARLAGSARCDVVLN